MCVCMFEQGGMFVWRGTALTPPSLLLLLQRWKVALVVSDWCVFTVLRRLVPEHLRHRRAVSHFANVSEELDAFRPQRQS